MARWLAEAARGRGDLIAPNGIYVCGSVKEEFGLALLEALAAGLVVVGPAGGGPATYVEEGVTGFLVDTTSTDALQAGMRRALDMAGEDDARSGDRIARARAMVTDRFTVQDMARTLTRVYDDVTRSDR